MAQATKELYGLSAADVGRLRNMLVWFESQTNRAAMPAGRKLETRMELVPVTTDSDGDSFILNWDTATEDWNEGEGIDLADFPAGAAAAFFDRSRGSFIPAGTPLRRFEALQNWTGSLDGSAHFPAKQLKRSNNTLQPFGDAFEVYDFQNFSGKMGARGWCAFMEGRWEHITSSCPT